MHQLSSRASVAIFLAVSASLPAIAAAQTRERPFRTGLESLKRVGVPSRITALPINSPPVNGFVPRVLVGLTDARDADDLQWNALPTTSLVGNQLSSFGDHIHYEVATFDTGAQVHLFRDEAMVKWGVDAAGLQGPFPTKIYGAGADPNNPETADDFIEATITDPIGVYITGASNMTAAAPLTVNTSAMRGQYNTSVLRLPVPESAQDPLNLVPNLIGAPMAFQYSTHIRNSLTTKLTVNGETFSTPQVDLLPAGTQVAPVGMPAMPLKATLSFLPSDFARQAPTYLPSFAQFDDFSEEPGTPTSTGSLFLNVNVTEGTQLRNDRRFLFDTGAEVTVISSELADIIGVDIYDPAFVPDFTIEVNGVTGSLPNVPGFYLDTLELAGVTGGSASLSTWHNVPVIVLDIPDPADGEGFVPGIIGTNLFTDRDMLINVNQGAGAAALWFSDVMTASWNVNASGNWSSAANWVLGAPDAIDAPANFLSKITSAQSVNVDGNYTVGSMKFDNAASYTLSGAGSIRVENSTGAATVSVVNGSHTISVPVRLASNTTFDVTLSNSTLTFTNAITSTGGPRNVTKTGSGTVATPAIAAASLAVNGGTLKLTGGTSRSTALTVGATGKLDLTTGAIVVDYNTGGSSLLTTLTANVKAGRGTVVNSIHTYNGFGVISSAALAANVAAGFDKYAVGIVNNADYATFLGAALTTFGGLNVDASSVLMRYTYNGDANLDGKIDSVDYNLINRAFAGTIPNVGWLSGDFNLDGAINADDYAIIDFGKLKQGSQIGFGAPVAVPEPTSIALLTLGGCLLSRRRR